MAEGRRRMSERTTRSWALTYAELGWRVFAVVPGGKRPLYSGWQQDATTAPALIKRWWRSDPGPNIGLICGEAFVAFDIEADHLPAFRTWLRTEGHRLPDTPVARTGRGGIHILVRAHASTFGHSLRLGGVHIGELKAAGGFIVACPSRTSGSYGWHRSPLDLALADAPDWLMSLATARQNQTERLSSRVQIGIGRGERRLAALARTVASATEGRRNSLLYWAMRRAVDEGIPAPVAESVLGRMAASAGLGEREISATIRSAQEASAR